ncbi:hypothetical protein GCK72_001931 [Caenorhabditis remanei]|uniref:Uncharacterized protein n=1 Tax=Caenorhabditis remanei TaxID=31234 RepID=A0A6A5HV31_CAERE|nr:hypothetical protein GCK72_001931 [Caenorhabditis remanei]KAF1770113.1 hypothetical protein GCK72_001931 [Caenorhabditis remanei]
MIHVSGCSKKKSSAGKTSNDGKSFSSTNSRENLTAEKGSKDNGNPERVKKSTEEKITRKENLEPPQLVVTSATMDAKKKGSDRKKGKKKSSGETAKKKSAKSEQKTQTLDIEKSKVAQKSCLNTAIIGSTMMGTMREPSKISKISKAGANANGVEGGEGGDGGYEKLGDLSADELKRIADAAPA